MNNFERHGIKHLSPSSINMFADCAGAWAARYLFNKNFKFGVAAQIGVLTERVVEEVLLGSGLGDALDRAHSKFNKENALNVSEKDLKRIHDIESMAILALEALTQYGEPEVIQKLNGNEQQKIEIICNGGGWSIPVIGYLGFCLSKTRINYRFKNDIKNAVIDVYGTPTPSRYISGRKGKYGC
jgi:hypothetical protein